MLNADAAALVVLEVDAGDAANDGQSDVIQIHQDADQTRVLLNGRETQTAQTAHVSEIHVTGSGDNDILVADLLAGAQLKFDGRGGHDQLVLHADVPYDSLAYELQESGEGQLEAQSPLGMAAVSFRHVEQVTDGVTANAREVNFSDSSQHITLKSAEGEPGMSLLTVEGEQRLSLKLANPTDSFRIDTTSGGAGEAADRVELDGVGADFTADLVVFGSADDLLLHQADLNLGVGDLVVSTGSIVLNGSLKSEGATLDLTASESISITASSVIEMDSDA